MNENRSGHEPVASAKPPRRGYRVSAKNLTANRESAAHSTGPRSAAGKARSRLNALKHGLLASQAVNRLIEGEEAHSAFEALAERLEAHYRPEGPVEEMLVEKVAIASWRLRRILRYEAQASYRAWREDQHDGYVRLIKRLGLGEEAAQRQRMHKRVFQAAGVDGVTLPNHNEGMLLMRYEGAVNRDLYRALAELRRLRRERGARPVAEAQEEGAQEPREPTAAGGPTLAEVEARAGAPRTVAEAKRLAEEARLADTVMDDRGVLSLYPQFFQTKPIPSAESGAKGPEGAESPPQGRSR